MQLTKIISTLIQSGRLFVKIARYGPDDIQTPVQVAPFGIDSNPVNKMIAVYSATSEKGKTVIVGYINENLLAAQGEVRLFSTDADGTLKNYLWLKNNGDIELGGSADNAVRYSKLNDELQNFKNQLQQQLSLIATGIATGGGSYTPGTLTVNLSAAKINEVKTT